MSDRKVNQIASRFATRRRSRLPSTRLLVADLRTAFVECREPLADSDSCWLGRDEASNETSSAFAVAPVPPGTCIGDYEIIREIGRGGMGIVYRARQISVDREVAIKILPEPVRSSWTAESRFLAESRAAARVHHTNVIAIHSRGEHDRRLYYAMELINGPSLARVIRSDPTWFGRDHRRLAHLFADLADGLAHVHAAGVLHRDIKPQNILIGDRQRLVLTDFGVARLEDAPDLTRVGDLLGTPAYLAPEQVAGRGRVDERTDVYAIGVTLYETLTGVRPFRGERREQTAQLIRAGSPTPPRRLAPDVPVDLESVTLRAMARDASARYPSAAALREDLRRFATRRRVTARRRGPLRRLIRLARARPGPTAMIAAIVMLAVVGTGWTLSAATHRRHEATRLLEAAYDTLAFSDYKRGDDVVADIEEAARLGAPTADVDLVLALADLGAERTADALASLETLYAAGGDDRVEYLFAWALWRSSEGERSRAVCEEADARGGPQSPDAWFFRGLAVHFDDPDEALLCYRNAIEMRVATQDFYPQAALHLARAHNQRIYAERSLEPFAESEHTLRSLAEFGAYGAYPHYLLSVAHRLAAEIYTGSVGIRGDEIRDEHFHEALTWARSGQALEPDHHHPIMAEAECLEAMGAFADAEVARTRAVEVSPAPRAEWENHHYRWRLRYWLGDLDGARADLARCADFDPEDRFYTKVYPALVLAEQGDTNHAARLARSCADGTPTGLVWAVTTLRLVGRAGEADALLAVQAGRVRPDADAEGPRDAAWWRELIAHLCDGSRSDALEDLAAESSSPWTLRGETSFHDAARRLADGDIAGAQEGFEDAYRSFDGERRYTYHGKLLLRRLEARRWPTIKLRGGKR